MIGLLGGILGIGFSYGASFLLNRAGISFIDMGWSMPPTETTISIIPVACRSADFRIFSRYYIRAYPQQTMRLSALDAIKMIFQIL